MFDAQGDEQGGGDVGGIVMVHNRRGGDDRQDSNYRAPSRPDHRFFWVVEVVDASKAMVDTQTILLAFKVTSYKVDHVSETSV